MLSSAIEPVWRKPLSSIHLIRISILDLIIAARALHDFRLVAAGCVYATLELTEAQCRQLTEARVHWSPDR